MRAGLRHGPLLTVLCFVAACGAGRYDVRVVSSAGSPIPEAEVRVDCPRGQVPATLVLPESVQTTEAGRARLHAPSGGVPGMCEIHVDRPGYWGRRWSVQDVCTVEVGAARRCPRVRLEAELSPRRG